MAPHRPHPQWFRPSPQLQHLTRVRLFPDGLVHPTLPQVHPKCGGGELLAVMYARWSPSNLRRVPELCAKSAGRLHELYAACVRTRAIDNQELRMVVNGVLKAPAPAPHAPVQAPGPVASSTASPVPPFLPRGPPSRSDSVWQSGCVEGPLRGGGVLWTRSWNKDRRSEEIAQLAKQRNRLQGPRPCRRGWPPQARAMMTRCSRQSPRPCRRGWPPGSGDDDTMLAPVSAAMPARMASAGSGDDDTMLAPVSAAMPARMASAGSGEGDMLIALVSLRAACRSRMTAGSAGSQTRTTRMKHSATSTAGSAGPQTRTARMKHSATSMAGGAGPQTRSARTKHTATSVRASSTRPVPDILSSQAQPKRRRAEISRIRMMKASLMT